MPFCHRQSSTINFALCPAVTSARLVAWTKGTVGAVPSNEVVATVIWRSLEQNGHVFSRGPSFGCLRAPDSKPALWSARSRKLLVSNPLVCSLTCIEDVAYGAVIEDGGTGILSPSPRVAAGGGPDMGYDACGRPYAPYLHAPPLRHSGFLRCHSSYLPP
ncbi:hypothetical protein B0H14DRAFT_3429888 [Mycena olivaceomarginata]|nr:hypothetical protein B0H14DRAFT_3429888 [Mycena olivaceomarginata]